MRLQWILSLSSSASLILGGPVSHDGKPLKISVYGDVAAGIGSMNYINGSYRCMQHDQAYPFWLHFRDPVEVVNRACAWQHSTAVQDSLNDSPIRNTHLGNFLLPDQIASMLTSTIASLAPLSESHIAILGVGLDDIDFQGIIYNCLLYAHPFNREEKKNSRITTCDYQPLIRYEYGTGYGGQYFRTSLRLWEVDKEHYINNTRGTDGVEETWFHGASDILVNNIARLIRRIIDEGRKGPAGENFRLYVTGYGQLFNEKFDKQKKTGCNSGPHPFAIGNSGSGGPTRFGKINEIIRTLNLAVQTAIERSSRYGVRYIDIDSSLPGHRLCENKFKDATKDDPELWFWPSPDYDAVKDKRYLDKFDRSLHEVMGEDRSMFDLKMNFSNAGELDDKIIEKLEKNRSGLSENNDEAEDQIWSAAAPVLKAFQPKPPYFQQMSKLIADQFSLDEKSAEPESWDFSSMNWKGTVGKYRFAFTILRYPARGKFWEKGTKFIDGHTGQEVKKHNDDYTSVSFCHPQSLRYQRNNSL